MAASRPVVDGPRACTKADLEDALALINSVFRAGTDQDVRIDYPMVYHPSAMHLQRIVRVDGKLVAHVPVAPRGVISGDDSFTAAMISATVTHADHRHHGYGTACLMSCIRTMEEEGWPVSVLWTMERTFPFYQQAGYEAVASQGWVYSVGPEDLGALPDGRFGVVEYDAADPGHLDAIMGMHETEPLRIARSRTDYEALFSLPKVSTFLATDGGGFAGYLMYGESSNKPGLIEAGGPVEAVEALASHVVRSAGRDIQAITPLTPTPLGALCEARVPETRQPVEKAAGVGNQMHRINSLEGLLRSIRGHLGRQVGRAERPGLSSLHRLGRGGNTELRRRRGRGLGRRRNGAHRPDSPGADQGRVRQPPHAWAPGRERPRRGPAPARLPLLFPNLGARPLLAPLPSR